MFSGHLPPPPFPPALVTMEHEQDKVRTFEDLLAAAGGFGWWHVRLFCLISVLSVMSAWHVMVNIYFGITPEYQCVLPTPTSAGDSSHYELLPLATGNGTEYDQCLYSELVYNDTGDVESNTTRHCEHWDYDRAEYPSTIVTEWDLVCWRRALKATDQAVFMLGVLAGAGGSGVLSDRFGRKPVMLAAGLMLLGVGGSAALSGSYPVWIALRCLTAIACSALFTVKFVLFVEAFPVSRRGLVGMIHQVPFCIGNMTLAAVAYYCRVWWQLQLVITAPVLVMASYPWLLDESPRWLLARHRVDEAVPVLRKISRAARGPTVSDEQLRRLAQRLADLELPSATVGDDTAPAGQRGSGGRPWYRRGPLLLLSVPSLRGITIVSCWAWLVVSMFYYGITFHMADVSDSRYVSLAVSAALEVVAYLLSVPMIERLGRRPTTAALFLLGAAALPAIAAVPESAQWARMSLLHAARLAASTAFSILYLYSAELFPTGVRTTGVGCCSVCARIGSMAAPYIVELLLPLHWSAPSVALGGTAASAGLAVLILLPETRGRRLVDVLPDGGYDEQTDTELR